MADIWWYETRQCWCTEVTLKDGRRKKFYLGRDKAKAKVMFHKKMAEFHEELNSAERDEVAPAARRSDSIPLLRFASQHLDWMKANRAHATWRTSRDGLKYVIRRYRDKTALGLSPSDIEALKADMVEAGYRSRTINIMIVSVKRMYNWGVRQNLVENNQLSGVEKVSSHVNAPDHVESLSMPPAMAKKCIELCRESQPLGDICEALLWTGMRVGEITNVRWGDIDFSEPATLTLHKHKTSDRTGRPRKIPLCSRVVELIEQQRTGDITPETHVFRGINGQPFTPSTLQNRLRRLREKHPELRSFHFHRMRHTCATLLAKEKVPERVAQAILGHSSKLMTRYYTTTDIGEMQDALERLSSTEDTS